MTTLKKYYTYAYLRENRIPYYIGKGCGGRAYHSHKGLCPEDKSRILFLKKNLTEDEAYKHEEYLVFVLGRKSEGGCLVNISPGGRKDGGSYSGAYIRDNQLGIFAPGSQAKAGRIGGLKQKELKLGIHGLSKEEHSKVGQMGGSKTKEMKVGLFDPELDNFSSDKQKDRAKILFQCPKTGKITTGGPLARWQKKRGIDHTNNIRLPNE
jgi:hypothetical protein